MTWAEATFKIIKFIIESSFYMVMVVLWLMGLALAKGFWLTLAAIIPLVAWCLSVDYLMVKFL